MSRMNNFNIFKECVPIGRENRTKTAKVLLRIQKKDMDVSPRRRQHKKAKTPGTEQEGKCRALTSILRRISGVYSIKEPIEGDSNKMVWRHWR